MKFELGQTVMTRGINALLEEEVITHSDLMDIMTQHVNGDWGDICEEDKESNDYALKNDERLMSTYTVKGQKLWIITEWDRSVTTILLPSEY